MVRCRFIAVRSLNHYLFEKALSRLRGAIGSVYRGPNVAGAAGGTRSFHPWYRRGKGILHPTFRSPSSSQKPVPVYTVIGCHRPGSQAFDPSFPAPYLIPASHIRFCPDTPSASLLSVVPHTSRLFLPYTAPVPRVRFHSCSRPDTCLQPVPAPVALPPRPYLSFPACS